MARRPPPVVHGDPLVSMANPAPGWEFHVRPADPLRTQVEVRAIVAPHPVQVRDIPPVLVPAPTTSAGAQHLRDTVQRMIDDALPPSASA